MSVTSSDIDDVLEVTGSLFVVARGQTVVERMERQVQEYRADLIRDIFGPLPFRHIPLDPIWMTAVAVSLTRTSYEDRSLPDGHLDRGRLAVLADALQEAGCEDLSVLGHLRQEGAIHVRGCWVIDLLLQKE